MSLFPNCCEKFTFEEEEKQQCINIENIFTKSKTPELSHFASESIFFLSSTPFPDLETSSPFLESKKKQFKRNQCSATHLCREQTMCLKNISKVRDSDVNSLRAKARAAIISELRHRLMKKSSLLKTQQQQHQQQQQQQQQKPRRIFEETKQHELKFAFDKKQQCHELMQLEGIGDRLSEIDLSEQTTPSQKQKERQLLPSRSNYFASQLPTIPEESLSLERSNKFNFKLARFKIKSIIYFVRKKWLREKIV